MSAGVVQGICVLCVHMGSYCTHDPPTHNRRCRAWDGFHSERVRRWGVERL